MAKGDRALYLVHSAMLAARRAEGRRARGDDREALALVRRSVGYLREAEGRLSAVVHTSGTMERIGPGVQFGK